MITEQVLVLVDTALMIGHDTVSADNLYIVVFNRHGCRLPEAREPPRVRVHWGAIDPAIPRDACIHL